MSSTNEPEAPLLRMDEAFFRDPYPTFARMRSLEPLHRTPWGALMLTRYADLVAVLKDPRFGRAPLLDEIKAKHGEKPYVLPAVFSDPPEHTRLRGVLSRAFTLRIVEALVPEIERVTNELLDRVADRPSFDLVGALAYKLPIETLCRLLGMPGEDHDRIHELSEAHAAAMAGGDPTAVERAKVLRNSWAEYFKKLAEERRQTPGSDLISELVRVHDETEKLTEYELLATIVGLLFAGHSTTADTIATGVYALLSNRDQWDLLVREPARLDGAVEEILRWDPAVQIMNRVALTDAEIDRVAIPKGTRVMPLAGAANRDPAQFAEPDRFDVTRSPNKHVTFAPGIHSCSGNTLARTQIKIVVRTLVERFPKLSVTTPPTFRPNFVFRGLTRLDVGTT